MIKSLNIQNFKSWRSLGSASIAPLTGLFGSNSSGKSSLLHLLLLLKRTVESPDKGQVLELRSAPDQIDFGSFRDLVHGHDTKQLLRFALDWSLTSPLTVRDAYTGKLIISRADSMRFGCAIQELSNRLLAVESMQYEVQEKRFAMERDADRRHYLLSAHGTWFEFQRGPGRPSDLPAPPRFYRFPDQVNFRYQNASFLADFETALQQLLTNVYHLGPLRDTPIRRYTWTGGEPSDLGPKGQRWVDALLAARRRGAYISPGYRRKRLTLEERVAHWLKELELIHSFDVDPISRDANVYEVRVRRSKDSSPVLIPDVGFGVSQVLPVLILCYYAPEGSTILLEQPEIHLHPSVQAGLADVFIDAVINRSVQIVFESHSEHLLHRLRLRIAQESIPSDLVSMYFTSLNEQCDATLTPLDIDMFGTVHNWPRDFFGNDLEDIAAISKAAIERKKKLAQ